MHPTITRKRLLGVVLVASMSLAACGGGDGDAASDPANGGSTNTGSATSTVTMADNGYAPAEPVIAAGDIELVNEGESPHTFTIDGEDVDVEVAAGETATATVDLEAGTYTLFCQFHRTQGMETTLTVE
jgi:plastocyanin